MNKKSKTQDSLPSRATINTVTSFDLTIDCNTFTVLPSETDKVEYYLDGKEDKNLLKGRKLFVFFLMHTIKASGHDVTIKIPNERLSSGFIWVTGHFNKLVIGDKSSKILADDIEVTPLSEAQIEINANCNALTVGGDKSNITFDGESADTTLLSDEGNMTLNISVGDNKKVSYMCDTDKGDIKVNFKDFDSSIAESSIKHNGTISKVKANYMQESNEVDLFFATSNGNLSITHDSKIKS